MMKNKKIYIITAVAAVLVFTFLVSVVAFFSDEKVSAFFSAFSFSAEFDNEQPFSVYNYERLNETEKKAYICIFENIGTHPKYIKVPKLTKEEFNNVYFAVKNDNPHMLCFSDSCNMVSFWSASFFELNYTCSSEECDEKQREMFNEIENIVNNMPVYDNNFDKELYIHDYIALNCKYEESVDSSNAYGCIVKKRAVCSGYSRAAMLLLDSVGIKSVLIGGTGNSPTQGQISHMWNIVWLGGETYHLDVTWDDPGPDENISHLYFNLSDEEIGTDHTNFDFSRSCDAVRYNYFRYKGLYFDSYGKNQLATIQNSLLNNIESGINYLEIRFSSVDAFEKAEKSVINGSTQNSDMYRIISFISSHAGDKVDVSHVSFSSDINKKYIRLMFDWN